MLTFSFDASVTEETPRIDVDIDTSPALNPVKQSIIMTHTDTQNSSEPRFSHAILEHTSQTIKCSAFPFKPGRVYNVNAQYFYRPLQ